MLISTSIGDFYFLPYRPNGRISEVLKFLTDINEGLDGTEERLALRDNPRLEVRMKMHPNINGGKYLTNYLFKNLANDWIIPLWYQQQIVSSIGSAAASITIDTDSVEFYDDGLLLIWESPVKYEINEVDSFNSTSVTLKNNTTQSYSNAFVMPSRYGRILQPASKNTNGYEKDFDLIFEAKDHKLLTIGAPTQYDSKDIYTDDILYESGGIKNQISRKIYSSDGQAGIFEQETPWTKSKNNIGYNFIEKGIDEIHILRSFLHRRVGKYLEFYQPTFEEDIRIKSTGTITTSLLIEENGYRPYTENVNNIAVKLTNGDFSFHEITNAIASDSTTDELTISPALNELASDVAYVSFLQLKRLDNDAIEMNHYSDTCSCVVSVKSLL